MKKQILQIFHSLIGKDRKPDGKTGDHNPDAGLCHDADQVKQEHGVKKDVPEPVKMVDRKAFERLVNESLGSGREHGGLLIGDVDRFRDINNIYGRDTGDAVLQHVADVLCDVFRGHACIGSRGSDIFALWLPEMSGDHADAMRRLTGIVNDRLLHPTGELPPLSLSMGVSYYERGDDCRSLVKKANKALYIVKGSGRCGCEFYFE